MFCFLFGLKRDIVGFKTLRTKRALTTAKTTTKTNAFGKYQIITYEQSLLTNNNKNKIPTTIQKPEYFSTGNPLIKKGISINTKDEIFKMKESCKLAKEILIFALNLAKVGTTTTHIDEMGFICDF